MWQGRLIRTTKWESQSQREWKEIENEYICVEEMVTEKERAIEREKTSSCCEKDQLE